MRIFRFFVQKMVGLDVFDGQFLKILNNKSKNWLALYSQTSELSKEVLHGPVPQGAAELQIVKVWIFIFVY